LIKIDDSEDCLVNFEAIGTQQSSPSAYTEPCDTSLHEAARPAHVIPPDKDSNLMSKISFHLPDPISRPLPLQPTPTSMDHLPPCTTSLTNPPILTAADFDALALQPLSKRQLSQLHQDPHNLPHVPPSLHSGCL